VLSVTAGNKLATPRQIKSSYYVTKWQNVKKVANRAAVMQTIHARHIG